MGSVADTSLRALEKEIARLHFPLWLQRFLFSRKAKGTHGVHSPLAYQLATTVFTQGNPDTLQEFFKRTFPEIPFQSIAVVQLPEALHFLFHKDRCALWVESTSSNRALWLQACKDPNVALAIDCFDFGLLLRTPDVKEKQYLRQKTKA